MVRNIFNFLVNSFNTQANHHYNVGYGGGGQNMNKKPLNNYNPQLSKKVGSHSNSNILHRPGTSTSGKGPVKIRSDVAFAKKPSTPDQFSRIRRGNIEDRMSPFPSSTFKRPNSKTKNDLINSRPSTAPQKDKKRGLGGTMIVKGNFSGPNRRLPSPQIHSSGFGSTQKLNPSRYRAPSPVIKSGLNMGGSLKRNSYQKNNFY
ncbi:MAG: hypothetical protein MJ252_17180 [archaeon]|nr:hypothetical protein [archaeon]